MSNGRQFFVLELDLGYNDEEIVLWSVWKRNALQYCMCEHEGQQDTF